MYQIVYQEEFDETRVDSGEHDRIVSRALSGRMSCSRERLITTALAVSWLPINTL